MTKLHILSLLNESGSKIDISLKIEAMQYTIEFENELAKRYPTNNDRENLKSKVTNEDEFDEETKESVGDEESRN